MYLETLDAARAVDAKQPRGAPHPVRKQTCIVSCAQAHAMDGYNATVRMGGKRLTLRVIVHEVWGGFDGGAEAELDELAACVKATGVDGTDYAGSSAPGAFSAHWARKIAIVLLLSHGELFCNVADAIFSDAAMARAAAHGVFLLYLTVWILCRLS